MVLGHDLGEIIEQACQRAVRQPHLFLRRDNANTIIVISTLMSGSMPLSMIRRPLFYRTRILIPQPVLL